MTLRDEGWLVELHDDHFGQLALDEEIFPVVAERGWVFVTQDRRIRTRPAERLALIEYGLRTFSIASTANLSAAVTIGVLRAARAGMDHSLHSLEPPFVVAIRKNGSLQQLDLD